MSTANSGVSTLTSDSCAGCHRAHTAKGEMLINAPTEEDLCFTCHGAASTGSTVDVMTGLQYALAGDGTRSATQLGALRGGGFDQARIDAGVVTRLAYLRNAVDVSQRPKVGVGAAENVNSSHIGMAGVNDLTLPHVAWGNGANGTGAGPAAEVSCASCHNPHGNGNYRILNAMPEATGIDDAWVIDIRESQPAAIADPDGNGPIPAIYADSILTVSSHGLQPGDAITIAGHVGSTPDLNGNWFVKAVGSGSLSQASATSNSFTISATKGGTVVDITVSGTGGTVTRTSGVVVADATLPTPGDTRNYTIMQVKGTEGTESTYLLYASQVATAAGTGSFNGIDGTYTATGGDYFVRNVPWNPSINNPACDPSVYPYDTTACATANSAPNGRPSTFSGQITSWCTSCHTRYLATFNTTADPTDDYRIGARAWAEPRPGDPLFNHQHSTTAGRDCLTCHVSHGSNAAMTGTFSSTFTYPNATASNSSRLLKIDNRGTCQACHDPTGTVTGGTLLGPVSTVP